MAKFNLIMPKMGESIMEATILKWVKKVGDSIEIDDTILEIATDKVDSEIPSPVSGVLSEILFQENDVVEIGKIIAVISTEVEEESAGIHPERPAPAQNLTANGNGHAPGSDQNEDPVPQKTMSSQVALAVDPSQTNQRFYSPLVKNIAKKENISLAELDRVPGTGKGGRLTKKDLFNYLRTRPTSATKTTHDEITVDVGHRQTVTPPKRELQPTSMPTVPTNGGEEIIEMDRMRRLIADHMVMSKHTSPHVTSFIEVDVTDIVNWRNRIKESFLKTHGEKFTFTPIFIQAVTKALQDFPMVNISLDGNKIIKKKNINIGMATALPSGNLIVPVIKNADQLNLLGLAKTVNDLALRARKNKLQPTEIQDGTFTVTNVGTFGNVMGTPIINQPQVAILAVGAIRKKPAVVETQYGDLIAIRHMMFLSLSYDHRIVDGFLGGSFLRKIGDYLEQFDDSITI